MGVLGRRRPPHHQPRCVHLGLHLRQLELGVLELGDGLAELLALLHVGHGLVNGPLGDAHCLGADADAPAGQGTHGDLIAQALLAQQLVRRNPHVHQRHLTVGRGPDAHAGNLLADGEARCVPVHHKGGQPLHAPQRLVGQGEDDEGVGKTRVGGEHLLPVEDVEVPVPVGGGQRAAGVGARAGLGQAEAAYLAAVHQGAQKGLLLLLAAVLGQAGAAQRGVHRDGDAHAGVHPGQLLHAQRVGQHVAAHAAVLLAVGDPHQPIALELVQQAHIKGLRLVHLGDQGLHLALRELPEHLLGQRLFPGKLKTYHTLSSSCCLFPVPVGRSHRFPSKLFYSKIVFDKKLSGC